MKKTDLFDNEAPTQESTPAPIVPVGPITGQAIAPAGSFADLGFDIAENMEGVKPVLPQIGIISQAQMFRMPDESKRPEIVGTAIDSNRCNAYWKADMSEGGAGNPPDCASVDGVKPYTDNPIHPDCAGCPMNRYGSGKGGLGKACKNMRRVHVLLEGDLLPHRLTLPPTSLKPWDELMIAFTSKGRPYQLAVLAISLHTAKNKAGIEYSQAVFTVKDLINDPVQAKRISEMRKTIKAMTRDYVQAGEYIAEKESDPF